MSESKLAGNLRYLREINGYTQDQVRRRINVARQTYSTYETGRRVPSIDTVRSISELYGVSIDSLMKNDLSRSVISEAVSHGHDAVQTSGSRIHISGAEAKMLSDYKALPTDVQAEIREFVRFKKYLDKSGKNRAE